MHDNKLKYANLDKMRTSKIKTNMIYDKMRTRQNIDLYDVSQFTEHNGNIGQRIPDLYLHGTNRWLL